SHARKFTGRAVRRPLRSWPEKEHLDRLTIALRTQVQETERIREYPVGSGSAPPQKLKIGRNSRRDIPFAYARGIPCTIFPFCHRGQNYTFSSRFGNFILWNPRNPPLLYRPRGFFLYPPSPPTWHLKVFPFRVRRSAASLLLIKSL